MRDIYINCSCGGGASVKIQPSDTNAVTECACGKLLLWAGEAEPPSMLSVSVSDQSSVEDKFGE